MGDAKSCDDENDNDYGKKYMGKCFKGLDYFHGVHYPMKLSFRSPLFEYPLLSQYPS